VSRNTEEKDSSYSQLHPKQRQIAITSNALNKEIYSLAGSQLTPQHYSNH
jgi:hypothetical protein